jgi:hypothetical protein
MPPGPENAAGRAKQRPLRAVLAKTQFDFADASATYPTTLSRYRMLRNEHVCSEFLDCTQLQTV